MRGFMIGSLVVLTLFFGRFIGMIAFLTLPIDQAILLSIGIGLVSFYIQHIPRQKPGFVYANPPTRTQSKIIESLKPYLNYNPPWWFLNTHFTTILPILLYKLPAKKVIKQTFLGDDGAPIHLDWYIPYSVSEIRGVILAIPGLNGSSRGGYIVDLMQRMEKQGIAVAVLNGRGAGRTSVHSIETSFHLGRPSDLLRCLENIENMLGMGSEDRSDRVPIYVMGYSAGGLRAVSFASVYGEDLVGRVDAVFSFGGVVKNDETSSSKLSTLGYQPVIVHAYASTMYSKFIPHLRNEDDGISKIFKNGKFTTFIEYDMHVTTRIFNTTLQEYYNSSLPKNLDKWKNIAIPTLIVNACDDPVLHVDDAVVPEIALNNSFVTFMATEKGGHIGWPTGLSQVEHGYKWMSDVVICYLNAIQE
jgi:predicted alpha/beta-fold hydrolase